MKSAGILPPRDRLPSGRACNAEHASKGSHGPTRQGRQPLGSTASQGGAARCHPTAAGPARPVAVSVGAGRLVPELSGGPKWPFELIGVAFAVSGLSFMAYGYVRHRAVDEALVRGEYRGFPNRAAVAFALMGALLGLATILVVLIHPA